ncbi:hypothetical protein OO9_16836 [Providencia alcalifaciens Dmel2]|nr:hypothetical protein OO9_16836 [Providencia alcalifaciens Dmel2]
MARSIKEFNFSAIIYLLRKFRPSFIIHAPYFIKKIMEKNMDYDSFFKISYSYLDYFIYISLFLFFFLYILTRKLSINGLIDPFTYTYTFTYSTSYSVIIVLYGLGYISNLTFFIFFFYGVLFLLALNLFSHIKYTPLNIKIYNLFVIKKEKSFVISVIITYIILTSITIYLKGFSIFTDTNRFEDNRGLGPIVRILELASLTIVTLLSIIFYNKKKSMKKYIGYLFILLIMIFNAMISGAKADLLFYIFSAIIGIKIFDGKFKLPIKYILFIFSISLIFALISLFYNFKISLDHDASNIEIVESLFKRLTDRILSNGDMYYMGLPNDIYLRIETNNVLITFLSPVFSYSFMSSIIGYDVSQLEIGKQFLLAHYPGRKIAGGPTDHIDFFSLLYFGPILGAIFIIFTSFILCFIRSLAKLTTNNITTSTLIAIFWMKSLSWLLKPGLIIGSILYFILFIILIKFFIAVIETLKYQKIN